ncbi:MAG: hypothetical protein ACLS28_00445 [Clostridium neonatale]
MKLESHIETAAATLPGTKIILVITTNVDCHCFHRKQDLTNISCFIHKAIMDYGNVQSHAAVKPIIMK